MEYNVYLKYNAHLNLNLDDRLGELCDHVFADIMYETEEGLDEEEFDEYEGQKIGFISWFVYNQVLAMTYGANMTQVPFITFKSNKQALMELDHTCMSQETIDEIGVVTNTNVMVLEHFGISADWRNNGIGEQVLKGVVKQMKGKCGYIMILHSIPAQFGECTGSDSLYEVRGVELAGLEEDPEKAQWK
ncbi:MAG TPA: hypothetical protein VIM79_02305, partial [Niastella sp.]